MEGSQVVVAIVVTLFFLLLPVVLMLDFWGDERLTARGRPVPRPWRRQRRQEPLRARGEDVRKSFGDPAPTG